MTIEELEYFRAYRAKHKEKLKRYHKEYWERNKTRYNVTQRIRYYEESCKKLKEKDK